MSYSMEAYEILYDESTEASIEALRFKGIENFSVESIWCGEPGKCEYVDAVGYPMIHKLEDLKEARKERDKRKSTEAQQKLNERNRRLKAERIANANFGRGDLTFTLTYHPDKQPESDEEFERDIVNFFRNFRYLRETRGLSELKYMYCLEKTYEENGKVKYHAHILMNGDGVTFEDIFAKWPYGTVYRKRYNKKYGPLSAFAAYQVKDKSGRERPQEKVGTRTFRTSRNLKKPNVTKAKKKLSKNDVRIIAKAVDFEAADLFEKKYPGYELISCNVRWSRFAPGPYIYARLRKKEPYEKRKPSRAAGGRRAGTVV